MRMPDGTVLNVGTSIARFEPPSATQENRNMVVRCKIAEVLYIDDPRNTTASSQSPQLQYNCVILDGPMQGTMVYNAVDTATAGGKYNFTETVRTPSSSYNVQTDADKDYHDDDGDIVLIQYLNGQLSNPMIMSGYKHPKSQSTATKDRGVTQTTEINGVRTTVAADGFYLIQNMGGPVDRDGNRTNPDAAGSSIGMSSDGTMTMARGQQKMELDKDGQIAMKGPDGTEFGMASGGTTTMKSTTTDLKAEAAFNVKSTLTSIGQGGTPSVKVGDLAIGTDSHGAPVISRLISGSFLALVGS